jgi:hypothetical protein
MLARSGPHPMIPVSAGVTSGSTMLRGRRSRAFIVFSASFIHPFSGVASSG